MKAKFINEKFSEQDSNVIHTMGIGDPEMVKLYKNLDAVNKMAEGNITGSFNFQEILNDIKNLNYFVYLTIKTHVAEKFNLNIDINIKEIEFAAVKIKFIQLRFMRMADTHELYISVSEVKRLNRKHLYTSSRCKTLDQLDKQIENVIKKFDLKIKP